MEDISSAIFLISEEESPSMIQSAKDLNATIFHSAELFATSFPNQQEQQSVLWAPSCMLFCAGEACYMLTSARSWESTEGTPLLFRNGNRQLACLHEAQRYIGTWKATPTDHTREALRYSWNSIAISSSARRKPPVLSQKTTVAHVKAKANDNHKLFTLFFTSLHIYLAIETGAKRRVEG